MSSIKLQQLNHPNGNELTDPEVHPRQPQDDDEIPTETQQLLPVDRGYHAWSFLAAATVIEALVWGFPFSVGVLHEYWTGVKFKDRGQEGVLTTAATLQSGLMYMAAIAQGPILQSFPQHRLRLQAFGLVCGVGSLVGSAFVTEPWHLLLTMGALYPISGFFYLPAATLIFEWFVEKRGMASGIMYSGTGVGGFVFPFVMSGLIERFGYKAGMCGVAGGYAVMGGIALAFIKPRVPIAASGSGTIRHDSRRTRGTTGLLTRWKDTLLGRGSVNLVFLQRTTFYAFVGNILLSSLSNFLPAVYIPSYASDLGISKPNGTILLAIMNAASVPGLLMLGYLSDKIPLRVVISLSCFGSALSCILLWGFATNAGVLVAFVVLFGLLGLSFSALWTKLITVIARDDPTLPPLLFSIFAFARGIGNVTSGPISSALLNYSSMNGSVGGYGQHNYGPLLVYTGAMMVLGGFCGITYRS
ncbi:hypothetical protein FFLO_06279 [Filobasidium floriforme]|uniref:Uncharacterized protein n=1 Tax=Filobasidium floriforme TaxID=5210 RepID=A0A8K0JKU7_9TREE|nr:hypothetical protein FFLO_06279 [Filobasidium floriforme]